MWSIVWSHFMSLAGCLHGDFKRKHFPVHNSRHWKLLNHDSLLNFWKQYSRASVGHSRIIWDRRWNCWEFWSGLLPTCPPDILCQCSAGASDATPCRGLWTDPEVFGFHSVVPQICTPCQSTHLRLDLILTQGTTPELDTLPQQHINHSQNTKSITSKTQDKLYEEC